MPIGRKGGGSYKETNNALGHAERVVDHSKSSDTKVQYPSTPVPRHIGNQ
jgi:hypothetical protein